MRIATIVPARGGSKGIPKKNVMPFCGAPLISWSIKQALASSFGTDVYVSTDDDEIAACGQANGAKIIRRPDHLAVDTAGIEGVMEHALALMGSPDVIVHLQPTSPVREASDIDEAVRSLSDYDAVFSASVMQDICLWQKGSDGLTSFTFDYRNRGRRQDRKPYYLENGSVYVFRRENIAKFSGRLGGSMGMSIMPAWKSFEIDSMEDVPICEYFMNRMLKGQTCQG